MKIRHHTKASESYVSVIWNYDGTSVNWDIPIEYRRTGTHYLEKSEDEINAYLTSAKDNCTPRKWKEWKQEQKKFWDSKPRAYITREFFDVLAKDFKWKSVESDLPNNPNWARRIQDIKEFGYTIATNTKMVDSNTGQTCTHLLLIPLPRGGISGYETWSKETRERIVKALDSFDEFEAKKQKKEGLLPDHKFPEIRWDENTKRTSLENLTIEEIKRDFQLMSNQRNQQKREVCRICYQTSIRGTLYGINYFYKGGEKWDENTPKRGKDAEQGCEGCAWYDIKKWRASLNNLLKPKVTLK